MLMYYKAGPVIFETPKLIARQMIQFPKWNYPIVYDFIMEFFMSLTHH